MKSAIEYVITAVLIVVFLCGCGQGVKSMGTEDLTTAPPHQFKLIPTDNPKKTSEGVYQVGWIRASMPNGESHSQMIPVEMDEPDVHWVQRGLEKQDVNLDGYTDIAVRQHGGAKWGRLHWYLHDPAKCEFYTNTLTDVLWSLHLGIVSMPFSSAFWPVRSYNRPTASKAIISHFAKNADSINCLITRCYENLEI